MTAATDAARHAPFDTRATPDEPAADVAHVEHVMGTAVSLHLRVRSDARAERSSTSTESDGLADHLLERACAELHRADALFSTWRPESPMSRVRCGSLAVSTAPREIRQVLDLCADVRRLTGGWFDPWAMPGGVDPTGLVKGWAVERAARSLTEAQIEELEELLRIARVEAAANNYGPHLKADLLLHETILRSTENKLFWMLAQRIHERSILVRALVEAKGTVQDINQIIDEHYSITRALRAHDPEQARQAMIAHLQAGFQRTLLALGKHL